MFDIGFFELLLIGVVAMLVIGPEQLPATLRTMGLWWGRAKRTMQATRTEFEQQIGADDIRRQLHNEEVMRRLQETESNVQRTLNEGLSEFDEAIQAGAKSESSTPKPAQKPVISDTPDKASDTSSNP